MKISTKGRYGLRIMLELSLHFDKNLLTVREIAEKQGISEKYIEQIISVLNKAGLVRSQRGAAGGYKLAEPPQATTVGAILRVTEGGLNVVDCVSGNADSCDMIEECVTIDVWRAIKEAIESVVDNITLADLVIKYNENFNFSYMI
ncbi:MAG: Rrf2 family transcriptional regulator [Oscillospiraceae bacterium]|jgi:Rrf2 family protein|nr:Rrf2 family transcriptional regulator [Oscillospiraceae bacterium]